MRLSVTGRHTELSEETRGRLERKIQKLSRYFEGIQTIEVVLDREGDGYTVGMSMALSRGGRAACQGYGGDIYSAMDVVVDKAEKQLVRYKEKIKDHRAWRHGGTPLGAERAQGPYDEIAQDTDLE